MTIYDPIGIMVSIMYLRTTQVKRKDGTVVKYYQLAHNERHPVTKKPVAKIIHSFGRADRIDRAQLVRLCKSIARVCGLEVIDPAEEAKGVVERPGKGKRHAEKDQ